MGNGIQEQRDRLREEREADRLVFEVPQAPRDPSARAKRVVLGFGAAAGIVLTVGAAFLTLGTIPALGLCWSLPADLALLVAGNTIDGEVLSAQPDSTVSVNGIHPTRVRYAYQVGGQRLTGDTDLLGGEAAALEIGGTVKVEVARLRPAWSRAKGGTRGFFGYWGALFLLFPAIGAAMVFFVLRGHWRRGRAFRTGTPVLARVVYAGPDTSTTVNGRHPFLVTWEFVADDGAAYQGSVSNMKQAELEEFAAKQQLVVLYDPARPKANALWVE